MAKPAQLYLYEDIGDGGKSASQFIDEMKVAGNAPIELHINSYGGVVTDGYAIYNALIRHSAGVTVFIDGIAASIASYIAMAGKEIFMADNALIMIHLPGGGSGRTAEEKRKDADVLDLMTNSLVDAYASRTGIPESEIRKMLDEETWLDSRQALAFGFVDGVTEPLEMAAKFDVKALSKFKNVPKKVMDQLATQDLPPAAPAASVPDSLPQTSNIEPQTSEARPSIFSRVSGWLKDNSALVNENASLRTEMEAKEREACEYVNKITELQAVVERLEVEVSQFRAGAQELEDQITALQSQAKTASERAVDIVAAAGFPQEELPAVQATGFKTAQDWISEYEAQEPKNRIKFYRENKAAIDKANAELKAAEKNGK